MARTKTDQKKTDSKGARRKTGVKKAEKALAHAEKAVDAARRAVKGSRKKLRKKASSLSEKTAKLSAKQAKAVREFETAREVADTGNRSAPTAAEPEQAAPVYAVSAVPASTPAESAMPSTPLTPPLPEPHPAALTLIELRRRAREQKIARYSRMSKADLIAALG